MLTFRKLKRKIALLIERINLLEEENKYLNEENERIAQENKEIMEIYYRMKKLNIEMYVKLVNKK